MRICFWTLPSVSLATNVTGTRCNTFGSLSSVAPNSKQSSSQLTAVIRNGCLPRTTSCFVTLSPGCTTPMNNEVGLTTIGDSTTPSTSTGTSCLWRSLVTRIRWSRR